MPEAYVRSGNLDHGYALTAHLAQGATVDRAFVLGSDELYREWGYTALSRHRAEARLYVSGTPAFLNRGDDAASSDADVTGVVTGMLVGSRAQPLALEGVASEPRRDPLVPSSSVLGTSSPYIDGQLEALRAARSGLRWYQRAARQELARRIDGWQRPREHWLGETERLARELDARPEPSSRRSRAPAIRSSSFGPYHARTSPRPLSRPRAMTGQLSLDELNTPPGLTRAELMTAREVAELLDVPVSTVREWGRKGTLPRVKLGRHVRFIGSRSRQSSSAHTIEDLGGVATRSCPLVEQLQGRLHASGEELVGQVAVGQCPGELEGPDHQPEDRERVGPSRLDVCRVEARRDVVDHAHQFVGEDLSGGGGAAGDLVEQRGRRAAVGVLVAVLRGQIGADERLQSRPIRGLGVEALALGAQLLGEDVRDEILLGREVGVELRWSGRRRTSRRPRRRRRCRPA